METRKPEYQHFIPQFLLRSFSHKYVPPDLPSAGKPKKRGRKNKMYPGDPVINSLCLSDGYRIDECLVRRVCGLENMYVDTAKPAKEQGNLEKRFGVLENRASGVIRKITKAFEDGKAAIWLKRSEKDILRKFIFLLTYRGEQYHRKYNFESMLEYDEDDKELLQAYMMKYGFTRPIDVWLKSLDAIIDLQMDAQGNWKKTIFDSTYFPIADSFVSHIGDMYMAICTPANPDEEFVLTDNCYNVSEGQTTSYYDGSLGKHITMCPRFHKFAPISPRLILVLRHNLLPEPHEDTDPEVKEYREFQRQLWIDSLYGSGTKSMLENLPVRKATNNYTHLSNGRLMPNAGWNQRFGADDEFGFTIFKLPTRHVRKMNGLLIDHAFHGSRIVFNRKDAFLDLMEWYLTEPCEVGKNLMGEHAATQLAYIKGLSQFMLREGRALQAEWTFWPSEHRDLKQFHIRTLAGARFLEEARRGENEAGVDFGATYERLGGTKEGSAEDVRMAKTMFDLWVRCVDLDWGSLVYEHLRARKLDWLLKRYQRQSCARFWMFLKHMRYAQRFQTTPSKGPEAIDDISSLEGSSRGSEDMLAYSHPVIQGRELNEAMYKAFNASMDLIRGPGRGLESMGYFSFCSDATWRIPTPAAVECWPWDSEKTDDESSVSEALLVSLVDDLNKKTSTDVPQQKQQFEEAEAEIFDVTGLKKAAHSWLLDNEKAKLSTAAVEKVRLDGQKESQKLPDAPSKTGRWVSVTDPEWPTYKFMEWQPDDGTEALTSPYANEKVHPAGPQSSTHMGPPPPRDSDRLKTRQAHQKSRKERKERILLKLSSIVLFAAQTFFWLECCSRGLAQLLHLVAAMMGGLSWALEVCLPAVDAMMRYVFYSAVGLKLIWLILGEIGW